MAAGPLSPQDRDVLLRAIIAGGGGGLEDPAASLQNLLRAPGGMSAAQAIVAGLRNRLLPQGAPGGPAGPAAIAARGLSGAAPEPTYAQDDEGRRPSGILGGPKAPEKKSDDVADAAKKLAEKTPSPPEPPSKAAGGILAMGPSQGPDPGTVQVPNIPDVPSTVNRSVARGKDADLTRSWMNFLMKPVDQGGLGRTLAQAKGEVASLHGESAGLNPNQTHDPDKNGNPTGYGTAAWRDDPRPGGSKRWTGLKNFAAQNGLDWKTPEGQMAWYREEMLTTHSAANKAIMAARTPQEALTAHVYKFEIPADKPGNAKGRARFFSTIDAAMGGAREVGAGPDKTGRGATTGPGLDPSLKPPPAPTQKAAPQPTGILGGQAEMPRGDMQAPTSPVIPQFQDAGTRDIKGIVIHHTAGREQTPEDVKASYAANKITGAHLFVDRQGNVSQTLPFDQAGQHTYPGEGKLSGFGNRNTIGIEYSAKNDADITPEQREVSKRLLPMLVQRYPGAQILPHGELTPSRKEATEGATITADYRSLGQNLPKPGEDVPLPPRRPDDVGDGQAAPQEPGPLTLNVTPSGAETPAPAPDTSTDLGPVTSADQGDLGGIPDVGGILGGLGGGDSSAADEPSQFQQDLAQDAKEPDRPILPPEDTKPGGILSGDDSLLADQGQGRVDLSRMFSPEGLGGTGLLGRDQGPDTSGFKAPVGLAQGGQIVGPTGILGGPSGGIASITPPQLRSIAPKPAAPSPPPRPSDEALGLQAPSQLDMPAIQPPRLSNPTTDILPPRRASGLLTDALPPPRPLGIGGEVPLPPRRPEGLGAPAPDAPGVLAGGPAADIKLPSLVGAPTPDLSSLSPSSGAPQPTGILGSPPAEPAMPGLLGRTFAHDAAKPTPPGSAADMSRFMDALGGSSGLLAGSGSGGSGSSFGSSVSSRPIATASDRRRFQRMPGGQWVFCRAGRLRPRWT
jgi:hypothetical protein